jgi:hypothetical protein
MANASLIAAESASINFLDRVMNPLGVLEKVAERAAMEQALEHCRSDDPEKKKIALLWDKKSQSYRQISDMLLADPLLSEEQRTKYLNARNGVK